jgi:hypothetical protein
MQISSIRKGRAGQSDENTILGSFLRMYSGVRILRRLSQTISECWGVNDQGFLADLRRL